MIDTHKLSWEIYDRLNEKGAEIGNASTFIIERVIKEHFKQADVIDKLPPGAVLGEQVDKQARLIAATWHGEEMRLLKDEIEALQIKLIGANLKIAELERVINNER